MFTQVSVASVATLKIKHLCSKIKKHDRPSTPGTRFIISSSIGKTAFFTFFTPYNYVYNEIMCIFVMNL